MSSRAMQHIHAINEDDMWETPPQVYDEFCQRKQLYLELDVCALEHSRKCREYFGPDHKDWKRQNAFNNLWTKNFFCNPPYSEKEKWLAYGIEQAMAHGVDGVFLIYAKTDTQWWADFVTEQRDIMKVFFRKGRIAFLKNGLPQMRCSKCEKMFFQDSKICPICAKNMSKVPAPYGSAWLVIRHSTKL